MSVSVGSDCVQSLDAMKNALCSPNQQHFAIGNGTKRYNQPCSCQHPVPSGDISFIPSISDDGSLKAQARRNYRC